MLYADIIPSHKVAQWLLSHIHRFLDWCGLERGTNLEEYIYVAIIFAFAALIGWFLSHLIRVAVRKVVFLRDFDLGQDLVKHHVLVRCCKVIPPLFILALLPFALTGKSVINTILVRGTLVYTTIVLCLALCTVATFIWYRVDQRNTRNLPLRGILDTVLGILWVIAAIVSVAIVVGKSPMALLGGLGAFAAVLMLIFKDSILGLVGGIQLSQNDMLHVGDWIVVPSTIANGIVIDVSLTTIKVQNWDNTIVTLPPYSLISGSFQNWRGMTASGCRQIARSILFEVYSIVPLSQETLTKVLAKYPIVKPYVEKLQAAGHPIPDAGQATVNGTIDTNMGLFRAYMCQWLIDNPHISNDSQILVRLMAPTENGIPLQIWCFTNTTAWTAYEAIQSDLFEHIVATAPDFGLVIYNEESGYDTDIIDAPGHVFNVKVESPEKAES